MPVVELTRPSAMSDGDKQRVKELADMLTEMAESGRMCSLTVQVWLGTEYMHHEINMGDYFFQHMGLMKAHADLLAFEYHTLDHVEFE